MDLDTILQKSLSASRDSRYASAAEFSADLERFLEHKTDPRPTSHGYPIHKKMVAAQSLVSPAWRPFFILVMLAGSILGSLVIFQRKQTITAVRDRFEKSEQQVGRRTRAC